jgi:hypothetical protein
MVNHICEPISSNQFASCSSARVGQGGGGAPLTIHPEQGRKQQDAAVAILDVSGMNDGVEQQTQRIYQNVAFLALDL